MWRSGCAIASFLFVVSATYQAYGCPWCHWSRAGLHGTGGYGTGGTARSGAGISRVGANPSGRPGSELSPEGEKGSPGKKNGTTTTTVPVSPSGGEIVELRANVKALQEQLNHVINLLERHEMDHLTARVQRIEVLLRLHPPTPEANAAAIQSINQRLNEHEEILKEIRDRLRSWRPPQDMVPGEKGSSGMPPGKTPGKEPANGKK